MFSPLYLSTLPNYSMCACLWMESTSCVKSVSWGQYQSSTKNVFVNSYALMVKKYYSYSVSNITSRSHFSINNKEVTETYILFYFN